MAAEVHIERRGPVAIVSIVGSIDGGSAAAVQEAIMPVLEPGCRLIIDLGAVDFMSSAGLRLMLLLFRQTARQGGKLILVGLSDEIRDTMSLTGFLDFFTTAEDLDAALATLAA